MGDLKVALVGVATTDVGPVSGVVVGGMILLGQGGALATLTLGASSAESQQGAAQGQQEVIEETKTALGGKDQVNAPPGRRSMLRAAIEDGFKWERDKLKEGPLQAEASAALDRPIGVEQ